MLKLRSIGLSDYSVFEGCSVTVHLPGGLPSAKVPARFRSPPRMEAHLSLNERISWSLNGFSK